MAANWMDRLFAGACFPAAFTIINAMLSDVVLGEGLAKCAGEIAAAGGMAVVLGPVMAAKLMEITGNPKYCCLLASGVSLLMASYVAFGVDETLRDVKPIDWKACNPFSFLELFRRGRKISTLALATLLERSVRDMHDVKMIVLKSNLGFDTTKIVKYMFGSGIQVVAAGIVGKKLVGRLGPRASTLVGNTASLANLGTWAYASSSFAIAWALIFDTIAGVRSLSANATLTTLAISSGDLGRGEIASMISQLANLTKIFCPYVYTLLFSRYGQKAPFLFASISICLSHSLLRQVFK